ncbi:hypothetical protein YC2023_016418 [Brassica napus]
MFHRATWLFKYTCSTELLGFLLIEIGWPIGGDVNAIPAMAQRLNPHRETAKVYIFSLVGEDIIKSIDPEKFERHWRYFITTAH